ncbi:MAG: hypothetical protein ACJAYX_003250 [Planctomycetota bacterium]|jgi:hypothetical protein
MAKAHRTVEATRRGQAADGEPLVIGRIEHFERAQTTVRAVFLTENDNARRTATSAA